MIAVESEEAMVETLEQLEEHHVYDFKLLSEIKIDDFFNRSVSFETIKPIKTYLVIFI